MVPDSLIGSFFPKDCSISALPATIFCNWFRISSVEVVTRKKIDAVADSAKAFRAWPPEINPIFTVVSPKKK